MYRLSSKDIDPILDKYTEKVNSKTGYYKIPYDSWRLLKKLASSELTFEVETKIRCGEIFLLLNSGSFHYDIPITYGFVSIMKERLTKAMYTDSNSATTNSKPNKPSFNMNIDFGPCGDEVAFSPYGLAIRNSKGEYFTYNPTSKQTIDVTGFTFTFQNMVYRMPVAASAVKEGDMIIHKHHPMFVSSISEGNIEVIDILESEVKTVIPTSNPFGFNFITKIMPIVNFGNTAPSPDQPFGNLMPMMMASMVFGDNEGNNGNDMGKMFMLSAMMGNSNPFSFLTGDTSK
jgi:hypothetical protein